MTNLNQVPGSGVASYFDLSDERAASLLGGVDAVWELIPKIPELVRRMTGGKRSIPRSIPRTVEIADGDIFIEEGATIEPGVYIGGSAYIAAGATLRHGAYIREHCILLEGSLLGHASEAKSAVLLGGAKAPHFAYLGDSILGHRVNLGAGTKLSNAAITRRSNPTIKWRIDGREFDTGLRKFGAIVGDDTEIGCNAVLNPGTMVGMRCLIYPGAVVLKGIHPSDVVLKFRQDQETVPRV